MWMYGWSRRRVSPLSPSHTHVYLHPTNQPNKHNKKQELAEKAAAEAKAAEEAAKAEAARQKVLEAERRKREAAERQRLREQQQRERQLEKERKAAAAAAARAEREAQVAAQQPAGPFPAGFDETQPLTYEEKRNLRLSIERLPADKVSRVLKIIEVRCLALLCALWIVLSWVLWVFFAPSGPCPCRHRRRRCERH